MNVARKHHFVPQGYLAGFTDDGKLTVFDLESQKAFLPTQWNELWAVLRERRFRPSVGLKNAKGL